MTVTLRRQKTVQITEIEVTVEVAEGSEDDCQAIIKKAMEADLPEDLYPYFTDATVRVVGIGFIMNGECRVIIEAVKEVVEPE